MKHEEMQVGKKIARKATESEIRHEQTDANKNGASA
jgi:hypothetical protein